MKGSRIESPGPKCSTFFLSRWWFQFFLFSSLPGEMIQFDSYFSNGVETTNYQEPQTTIYKWMFSETTIFYIKIWNHPIETTIYKWLFGVPGSFYSFPPTVLVDKSFLKLLPGENV